MDCEAFVGFDYGTSHCSMGVWRGGTPELVPLDNGSTLVASTLYAPKPDLALEHGDDARLDMSTQSFASLRFGSAALRACPADPLEGFFVKSPKSFLGAPGLSEEVKNRFISIVAAMEYESRLNTEQRVLVVDVGGGTTDCSFVRVGPQRARKRDRDDDVLGHTPGCRFPTPISLTPYPPMTSRHQ